MRTFKPLRPQGHTWGGESLPMECWNCGKESMMPTNGGPGALILTTVGMSVVFDPPAHIPPAGWLPDAVQCRHCSYIFEKNREDEDVR